MQTMKYIEDIQVFGVNMSFISLSEVKKISALMKYTRDEIKVIFTTKT